MCVCKRKSHIKTETATTSEPPMFGESKFDIMKALSLRAKLFFITKICAVDTFGILVSMLRKENVRKKKRILIARYNAM